MTGPPPVPLPFPYSGRTFTIPQCSSAYEKSKQTIIIFPARILASISGILQRLSVGAGNTRKQTKFFWELSNFPCFKIDLSACSIFHTKDLSTCGPTQTTFPPIPQAEIVVSSNCSVIFHRLAPHCREQRIVTTCPIFWRVPLWTARWAYFKKVEYSSKRIVASGVISAFVLTLTLFSNTSVFECECEWVVPLRVVFLFVLFSLLILNSWSIKQLSVCCSRTKTSKKYLPTVVGSREEYSSFQGWVLTSLILCVWMC